MSDLIRMTAWEKPLFPIAPVPPALQADVKRIFGSVPADFGTFAHVPWVARSTARVFAKRFSFAPIPLLELAGLVTAQENACRYCYGSQRAIIRVLGYREADLDRLERDRQLDAHGPLERAVLDFARALARSNPRPAGPELDALRKLGFTTEQIAEIAGAVCGSCYINRISTFVALAPLTDFERMPDKLVVRLLAPVFKRLFTSKHHAPPPPISWNGPCAPVVAALGRTWAAVDLSEDLAESWDSPHLSKRAKAAILAVIARTLGCEDCDAEACRVLASEGVAESAAGEGLRTLHPDWLDPAERDVVAWARDTVRYEPAEMQRRTRALAAKVGPEKTLEAIGHASLANRIVRLGMLVT